MNYSTKLLGKFLLPALMLVSANIYAAPIPTTSFVNFPATSFAGEEFCFDAPLSNTDPAVGYGPYLQLQLPPEITLTANTSFNGGPVTVSNLGSFPPDITDPLSSALVTGSNGYSLINIQPPIGSVVQGGPALTINICATIDAAAPIGAPLTIYSQAIFQFGDTPTGDNGAILGAQGSDAVSPSIVNFIKVHTDAENERPPGLSWPATYELRVDIANGNTIQNLDFADILPANLQYVPGSISVNTGTTGAACNTNVLGQNITASCPSALGSTVDTDLVVTYQAYVKDVLDEAVCDDQTLTNTATFNVDRDDGGNLVAVGPFNSSETLRYGHVKVQKSVTPGVNQGQLVSPGDTLTYTLNIQTTDYGVADSLVLTDILPDGLDPVSFTPVSVTLNGTPVAGAFTSSTHNNATGETTIVYNIGAQTGNIPAGSAIQVIYTAVVEQVYEDGITTVKANDRLTNNAEISYSLVAGAGAGAACTDISSATAKIKDLSISKAVINPQAEYMPGDIVTYRLSMDIPSGDTSGLIFKDFFPLPVFDVTTINSVFGALNANGEGVVLAPTNTIVGIAPLGAMIFDAATNSLTINWPDISFTTPQVLAVDITIAVGDQPFADNLTLSNLFESGTVNTPNEAIADLGLVNINIGAPVLALTKGVVATTHGNITPPVGATPENSNLISADGGDTVTFQITVENTGGAPAHDVVISDDLGGIGSKLQNCAVTTVQDGGGTALAYTGTVGAITLTNPLPASSTVPTTAGFAIVTMTCDVKSTVQPGEVITNTSSVVWGSGGAGLFPAVEDIATVTIRYPSILKTKLTAGTTFTIGQILRYEIEITVPELTINNFIIKDQLDPGLAFVSFTNPANYSLTSSAAVTTSPSVFNVTNNGTTLNLDLGIVKNSNTTDGTLETITLAYDVVVVNDAAANAGNQLNNQAAYGLTDGASGNAISGSIVNAPEITIVEPNIVVTKTDVTVGGGPYDAGDTITYNWFIRQTGSNLSDAFEVSLLDTLPANVTYVANSLTVASGSCSTGGAPVLATPTASTLTTTWVQFTTADSCNIQYQVTLDQGVLSGTTLQNDVAIEWSSLSGTHDATKSIYNANACERTSASNAGNCGAANDYDAASLANIQIGNVTINKALVGTSEVITGDTQHDAGESDLAIGETATFRLTVTIPEGTSDVITIADQLPNAASGIMEYVSSNIISIGTNLRDSGGVAQLVNVAPVISGANTLATWSFGQVVNIGNDNVVDDQDRIIIEITGIIKDNALNVDASNLTNNSSVNFGAGLNGTSSVNLDIVEPKLQIVKSSATTTADAGDVVTYSMVISHTGASTQDAFDVVMTDIVPAGMTYVANSIATAGTCNLTSLPADADPSGAGLSVVLDDLPLLQTCTVTFDATLDNNVSPGQQITNTAGLVWDTLPADNDPNERGYSANNGHLLTISSPGVTKVVTATTVGDTIINAPKTELTIGEQVTYQFTMTIPEGVTNNVVILDQLPTAGVALEYVSSQIISIGSDITITPAVGLGAAGDDCVACDLNVDGYRDQAQWNLGTVTNIPGAGGKTMVFEVVAVVVNDAINTYADADARNVASISFPDVVNGGTTTITGDVGVDLVEPILTIAKQATPAASPFFADAGDIVTFEITVDNNAANNSDVNAYNLIVTDTLANDGANALMEWNGDANVGGTCGAVVNSANASAAPFNVVFSVPTLALGASCTITYQVKVATLAQPSQTLTNSAALAYDSTSTAESLGETRKGSAAITSDVVINDASGLVKVVASTGHTGTGTSQHNPAYEDLTIGETVTYSITMSIPTGTTNNVVLTDIMPTGAAGVIEVVGTPTISLGGANITTTNATVSVNGALDGFNINFGSVTNVPDADTTNDKITVTVTGIVTDVAANVDGLTPTNTANFTFTDGANAAQVKSDTAIVDLVAPQMSITKSMTVLDGLVTVTVSLQNTGTATAYDININDVLDSANWDTATITPVTVPAGYTLATVAGPAATETTVVMASDGALAAPANSVEVGETITFVFTVPAKPNVATISNTATNTDATSLPGNPPVDRNVGPVADTQVINIPLMTVVKTADLATITAAGTISYTIDINNPGVAPLTVINVVDTLPDGSLGAVTGPTGDANNNSIIDAGETWQYTISYNVSQPEIDAGVARVNNVSVTTAEITTPVTDSATTTINASSSMTVVKLVGGVATNSINAPGQLSYTIDVDNTGTTSLTNVAITDTLPDGTNGVLTGPAGDTNNDSVLDVSETWQYTITYSVDQAEMDAGTQRVNNVTVTTTEIPAGVSDSATTTITQTPLMTVVKLVGGVATNSINAPGQLSYTIAVQNTGNVSLTGVTVADLLPDNTNGAVTFISASDTDGDSQIDVGETWQYTITYNATQAEMDAGVDLVNNVTVTTVEIPAGVAGFATTTITQSPLMTVNKQVDLASINTPGQLSYTIDVQNTGNVSLTNINVVDTLPDASNGVVTFIAASDLDGDSEIDVNETWQYTITYNATQAEMDAGVDLVNNVNVTTAEIGAPGVSSLATTTITQSPSMTVDKQVDRSTISAVGVLNYTITVTNTGNISLTTINAVDTLPDTTVGALSAPTGDTDSDGELDIDETWVYSISYTPAQAEIVVGNDIINSVSVDSDQTVALVATASTTVVTATVPTLSEWSKMLLILLLGIFSWTYQKNMIRRQYR